MERRQHFICLNPTLTIWQHLPLLTPLPPLHFPLLLLCFSHWTLHSFVSLFFPPSSSVHPLSSVLFAKKLPACLLPLALGKPSCSVCVCVCCRSTGTGFFGCQLQSDLTCASNVVYCPNTSREEHLRRPLKFKAIYHHLPALPPRSLRLPSSLTSSSFSRCCHCLLLLFSSFHFCLHPSHPSTLPPLPKLKFK